VAVSIPANRMAEAATRSSFLARTAGLLSS
jgi:hypothetical protein